MFFKDIDIAIQDTAPDETTAQRWKELASQHFQGQLKFYDMPVELQRVIQSVEDIYQQAVETLNAESEVEA